MKCSNCHLDIQEEIIEKIMQTVEGDIHCFVCGHVLIEKSVPQPEQNTIIDTEMLPHPMAICLEKVFSDFKKFSSPLEKLFSIRDFIEVTIKYLAVCEISVSMKENTLDPSKRKELLQKLARPSLGTWLGILTDLVKINKDANVNGLDIYPLFYYQNNAGKHKETNLLKEFNAFVSFRNTVIGHGARIKIEEYENHFQYWYQKLNEWDELYHLATKLQLVYKTNSSHHIFEGPQLPVKPMDENGKMYIAYGDETYYINPFIFIHLCDSCETIQLFFYDSNKNYGSTKTVPKVNVLEYDAGHKPAIHSPVKELEDVFGVDSLKEAFKFVQLKMAHIEGKILSWTDLIHEHAPIFGRQFLINRIQGFLDEKPSGIFLLTADPGLGKTALSSYLVEEGWSKTFFFYRRVSGVQSPNDFIRSIYHSLLIQYGIKETNPSNDPIELRIKLDNLLSDLSQKYLRTGEKCVLLVDALDEGAITSDGKDAFDLLPKELPNGVYMIATSRNTIDLNRIKFLPQISHYELQALSEDNLNDLFGYIQQHLPEAALVKVNVKQLAEQFEGNFLLTKLVMEAIKAGDFEVDEIDGQLLHISTLESFYDYYWETVIKGAEQSAGQNYFELIYQVLGLLAESKAPLCEVQMSGILKLRIGELEKAIRHSRQFLNVIKEEEEIYYRIFHDTFREYVSKKVKGSHQLIHEQVVDYYKEISCDDLVANEPIGYGLRYQLFHLAHAGNLVHLTKWLDQAISLYGESREMFESFLIQSLEDLVERPSIHEINRLIVDERTKMLIADYYLLNEKTLKLNLLSYVLSLLQTKYGDEGISLYFTFILRDLPTPLSRLGKNYKGETSTEKIYRLIDISEQILKFYAYFYMACYMKEDPDGELIDTIKKTLKAPSLGSMVHIIKKLIPKLYEKNQELYFDQASTWFTIHEDNMKPRHQFLKVAEDLVWMRNQFAHGALKPDEQIREQISTVLERIKILIHSLHVFSQYRLMEVLEQNNSFIKVRYYQGDHPEGFKEEWILFESEEEVTGRLYLKMNETTAICLSPFLRVEEINDDFRFLFLNALNRKYRSRYVDYQTGMHHTYQMGLLEKKLVLLSSEAGGEFEDRIQQLLSTFKGRKMEAEIVHHFIETNDRGFFIVNGPRTVGKTAFLAKMTEELRKDYTVIPYFASYQPAAYFYNYMNVQLRKNFGFVPENDKTDFFTRLQIVSETLKNEKLIMIIDALDEHSSDIEAIKETFITNVYSNIIVIYSMRENIEDLFPLEHTHSLNLDHFSKELSTAYIYEELSKYLDREFVNKLTEITEGNPLALEYLAELIQSGKLKYDLMERTEREAFLKMLKKPN
ncbi:hypothetical protein BTR23_23395 [Alkalihalophilus pseudofirmus]|nr:hypothetical protein BTR23_23395 [Alkalihalophilus pseudofirmus]